MTPLHCTTPCIDSPTWSTPDRRVRLKLENTQPTGSFKLRGIGHCCSRHAARGVRRLISSSGGNAGYAVAWAGHALGLEVVVVVPESTPAFMRAACVIAWL